MKADLSRLLRDALEKETDGRPFVIFLDLNLPPGPELTQSSFDTWIRRLYDEVLAITGEASAENPDPYSAVVFTNFSWQWFGDDLAEGGERFLVVPLFQSVPLPSSEIDRFWEAVNQYGWVPEG